MGCLSLFILIFPFIHQNNLIFNVNSIPIENNQKENIKNCPGCSQEIQDNWILCPVCEYQLKKTKMTNDTKKIDQIESHNLEKMILDILNKLFFMKEDLTFDLSLSENSLWFFFSLLAPFFFFFLIISFLRQIGMLTSKINSRSKKLSKFRMILLKSYLGKLIDFSFQFLMKKFFKSNTIQANFLGSIFIRSKK